MTGHWPAGLSAADLADYLQAQAEHEAEMRELADREFQVETGQIDSYADYHFTWQEELEATAPPPPTTDVSGKGARPGVGSGIGGENLPPF
ncbi:hypothetical protein ACIRBY_32405 [Streptomyces sp. NPDC096136]|uniref:hypothetical protein n=1 Tax=Streptomyces sp. NPDC096136 TaxID=3366076 RepID=UPI0037FD98AC